MKNCAVDSCVAVSYARIQPKCLRNLYAVLWKLTSVLYVTHLCTLHVGAILSAVRYCSKSSRHRYRKIILAVRNPLATAFVGVVHVDRSSRGPSPETPSVRLSLSAQSRSGAEKLLAPTALGRRARGPFAKPPLATKRAQGGCVPSLVQIYRKLVVHKEHRSRQTDTQIRFYTQY